MTASPSDLPPAEKPDRTTAASGASAASGAASGEVVVRYWAAARAAAGVESDRLRVPGPVPLPDVLADARARHGDRARFADVVAVCSILIGDRPVGGADPAQVQVRPGDTIELLPPFAGG